MKKGDIVDCWILREPQFDSAEESMEPGIREAKAMYVEPKEDGMYHWRVGSRKGVTEFAHFYLKDEVFLTLEDAVTAYTKLLNGIKAKIDADIALLKFNPANRVSENYSF